MHFDFAILLAAFMTIVAGMGCDANTPDQASDSTVNRRTTQTEPDSEVHKIQSNINDLTGNDAKLVNEFMASVILAFSNKSPQSLEDLSHLGDSERDIKNNLEFARTLMDGGDRVQSWTARPYSEPNWEIMEISKFFPEPTIWIDVTLNDGNRNYPFFFALAPNSANQLRSCYYVAR